MKPVYLDVAISKLILSNLMLDKILPVTLSVFMKIVPNKWQQNHCISGQHTIVVLHSWMNLNVVRQIGWVNDSMTPSVVSFLIPYNCCSFINLYWFRKGTYLTKMLSDLLFRHVLLILHTVFLYYIIWKYAYSDEDTSFLNESESVEWMIQWLQWPPGVKM